MGGPLTILISGVGIAGPALAYWVREARTQIMTLSAVRPDGRRTYDVSLRPLHETRGNREVEICETTWYASCSVR